MRRWVCCFQRGGNYCGHQPCHWRRDCSCSWWDCCWCCVSSDFQKWQSPFLGELCSLPPTFPRKQQPQLHWQPIQDGVTHRCGHTKLRRPCQRGLIKQDSVLISWFMVYIVVWLGFTLNFFYFDLLICCTNSCIIHVSFRWFRSRRVWRSSSASRVFAKAIWPNSRPWWWRTRQCLYQ